MRRLGSRLKDKIEKMKGAICNVPIECDQTCYQLPRPTDRKLQFRGQVYFQAVRTELIQQDLNWLKIHNPFYKDILVDINNIDSNLTALQNDANDNATHQHATSKNVPIDSDPALEYDAREMINNSNEEENDVPVNKCRAPVCEMCLESIIPNYPVVNAQVKPSIRSPCERSSSV